MSAPKKHAGSVNGVKDIVTQINPTWSLMLKRFQKLGRTYGFMRVETPIIEDPQVYHNYYKDNTDGLKSAVEAQIAGRPFELRSSFLPSVLRVYAQNKVADTEALSKWQYSGNVVHLDDKQSLVSDYEFGLEVFGNFTHLTEAQTIAAAWQLVQGFGLEEATLDINMLGDTSCQNAYQDILRDFLKPKKFELCDRCNEYISGRTLNVFRCDVLDCQVIVAEAPTILDFLDEDAHKHFTNILEALDELQIPYQLNPQYVGPDGFSKTNLVIRYKKNSQTVILGEGGYHEGLYKNVSGKNQCCFGFAGSFSSLHQAMDLAGVSVQPDLTNEVFLVPLGEMASKKSLRLFRDLTAAGLSVYDHFGSAGVKNQLKQAETYKSPIALIMGQKEAMDEMVILRDVKSGMQEIFSYDKIIDEVKKRLGK